VPRIQVPITDLDSQALEAILEQGQLVHLKAATLAGELLHHGIGKVGELFGRDAQSIVDDMRAKGERPPTQRQTPPRRKPRR
jgi:hypothetical protein